MSTVETKAGSKANTFEEATLQIADRSIAGPDYVMQISNISQASIGDIPRKRPSVAILTVCMLVAAGGFAIGNIGYRANSTATMVGVLALVTLGIYLYSLSRQEKKYGLILELNSGRVMSFVSYNREFLQKVLGLVNERMQNPGVSQEIHVAHFSRGAIDQRTQNISHSGPGSINVDSNVHNAL